MGPPRWLERVLSRVVDGRDREWIVGDLREEYARVAQTQGERAARRWYRGQVLGAVLPSARRRLADAPSPGGALNGFGIELRHAVRALRRGSLAALLVTTALAVALGANVATFAVVDAVVLRSLPYAGADRIVTLSETHAERLQEEGWASVPNALDWRTARTLEQVALYRPRSMALTGSGEPLYVVGTFASDGFFEAFGTPPLHGRTFTAEDTRGALVAIISHGLWRNRFGGDPALIGRAITIDGRAHTVIGIMPGGFSAPAERIGAGRAVDIWLPFAMTEAYDRGDRSYGVVARLAEGVTLARATTELQSMQTRLRERFAEANAEWQLRVLPWKTLVVGDARAPLLALWAAMALVFAVACANAANLFVGRMLARRGDLTVRRALGAPRRRIVLGALAEGWIVAAAGALGGVAVAAGLVALIRGLDPGHLPRLDELALDARALLFGLLLTILAAAITGGLTAVLAARARADLPGAGARLVSGGGARFAREGLALAQLALAFALLMGSVTALRAFQSLRSVDPGFRAEGVLEATVALSWNRVTTLEARSAFVESVLARLRALPGVESAAMINSLPLSGSNSQMSMRLAESPEGEPVIAALRAVSPAYAQTLSIPVRGREFDERDLAPDVRSALVNEAFARRYFGGAANAIGSGLLLGNDSVAFDVVGVLGDVRHFGFDAPARPEVYVAYTRDFLTSKSFVVRTTGDPTALGPAMRATILDVDPDQPIRDMEPMGALVSRSLALPRFQAAVLGVLSTLAVLLAGVGLFAVLAAQVAERTRELALRMVLGARATTVVVWMLGRTARLAVPAAIAGLALALALSRIAGSHIGAIETLEPMTMATVLLAFAAIAAAAALVPALRVARTQPARVLRGDEVGGTR